MLMQLLRGSCLTLYNLFVMHCSVLHVCRCSCYLARSSIFPASAHVLHSPSSKLAATVWSPPACSNVASTRYARTQIPLAQPTLVTAFSQFSTVTDF